MNLFLDPGLARRTRRFESCPDVPQANHKDNDMSTADTLPDTRPATAPVPAP